VNLGNENLMKLVKWVKLCNFFWNGYHFRRVWFSQYLIQWRKYKHCRCKVRRIENWEKTLGRTNLGGEKKIVSFLKIGPRFWLLYE
jgi:hypothetical protein